MSIISLIIKREFIAKIRNKSFIIMTFLSPLLFVSITLIIGYLSSIKADTKKIAIDDKSGLFIQNFLAQNNEISAYNYVDASAIDLNILKKNISNGVYEGVLLIPKKNDPRDLENSIIYISNDSPSISFIEKTQDVIAKKLTLINLEKANVAISTINQAEAKVTICLKKTSGEQGLKGLNEIKIIIGGAFGYLIMMFIIIYGNMVMRSVIEEKTNRIIEIIISSVKPFQLMIGKIIGTSLAGILQFLIWIGIGLTLLFLASVFFDANISTASSISSKIIPSVQQELASTIKTYITAIWSLPLVTLFISFIIYFVGGYFLYSSFYAAVGAAVDSETDSQQFLLPIIMPLILGVYIGFFTVNNDPQGSLSTIFSIFPLTSPIVMLMRIPFGVPLWQLVLSVLFLFSTFFFVVWFASKIYRIGILTYGKKPTWKELFRWLRY